MANKGLSSITKKLIMAITGGAMVFFLLFHASMNLVAIIKPSGYNKICEFLGANWYALVATVGLAALMVFHLIYAFVLSLQNYRARGSQRYAVVEKQEGVSWASKNMLVIGMIVLIGLGLHLFNFWANMQLPEVLHKLGYEDADITYAADGVYHIENTFSCSVYSIIYLVWLVFLWFHLDHGIASVMQSIGWSNHVWQKRIECIGKILAALIALMFASVVLYYWIGSFIG
ncbi:MAG: succinate dehydrogenase/fumarate reductase cytochrome b subunit [Bacteroidales bacterium]|nr:succinate dehydrogenase/fumarate reductase cytochrome b subunit [Bacteroidales bacterium]